ERVRARHDLHDRLAVANDAPDGMHGKLMHDARLRGSQIDALELILRRDNSLLELGDLALGFAQVLEHFGPEIPVELDNLQFSFADLAARTRSLGDELSALAIQARLVAL